MILKKKKKRSSIRFSVTSTDRKNYGVHTTHARAAPNLIAAAERKKVVCACMHVPLFFTSIHSLSPSGTTT